MFVRLLGPVGVGSDEQRVTATPGRIAATVLACLALADGRLVTMDGLVDAVWDDPPKSARNAIQVAVSRMRRRWGPDLIMSSRVGYRLPTALTRVDLSEVQQLLADGERLLAADQPGEALEAADAARTLFVGAPFLGLDSHAIKSAQQHAEKIFAAVRLVHAKALLGLGRASEAADRLEVEAERAGLDESVHALLMRSLAASGRPADALHAYDRLRHRLADELGMDPSPQLQEVFAQLLNAELAAPTALKRPRVANWPPTGSPILGRQAELLSVIDLLNGGHRIISLLGPGGIGKTRLAVAVAEQVAEGQERAVYFVDLTAVDDSAGAVLALSSAVGAHGDDFAAALADLSSFIVIDNAEHLFPCVQQIVETLLTVRGTRMLITSRSPLGLRDERRVWLDVLSTNTTSDPAVQLLADRADFTAADMVTHGPDLQAMAKRADGIPLVLELLASALRWESPSQILRHLDELLLNLEDESRGRPVRHLSVEATFNWTLERTSTAGRDGLGQLLLFRGSFAADAATTVLAAAVPDVTPRRIMTEMVDMSLLQRLPTPGPPRFRLLEPIRLHAAASRLVTPPLTEAKKAYALYYLDLANSAEQAAESIGDQAFSRLRPDEHNLRAASDWTLTDDPTFAVERLGPLLSAWLAWQRFPEVRDVSGSALSTGAGSHLARAAVGVARLFAQSWFQVERSEESQHLEDMIRSQASSLPPPWLRLWIAMQSVREGEAGHISEALELLNHYPAATQPHRVQRDIYKLHILTLASQYQDAQRLTEILVGKGSSSLSSTTRITLLNFLGYLRIVLDQFEEAEMPLVEAIDLCTAEGNASFSNLVRINLAWLALKKGHAGRAMTLLAKNFSEPSFMDDQSAVQEAVLISGFAFLQLDQREAANLAASAAAGHTVVTRGLLDRFLSDQVAALLSLTGAKAASPAQDVLEQLAHLVLQAGHLHASSSSSDVLEQ